ncbi:unnamed protein product [Onchocerca ochengi]|uniref:P4Ha_N domain-containing protein n=1 Tax=Onchocerca ochengi TaxID=42157 RepID=A0A182EPV6_ONCOC|nr:unnamed protein product [Onchocerca ochengi]
MISWTVFNIFSLITTVFAEFYTSITSLKAIIQVEKDIPIIIDGYIEKEVERLGYLKKDRAIRRGEEAIRHPINAFLLLKEMLSDWNKVVKIMRFNSTYGVIRNMTDQQATKRINYPTEEDLFGAAIGLLRLQDTYRMDTKDIADGKILNSQMRTVALTAEDCLEIGRTAYEEYDYYYTIMWMQEVRKRVEKESVPTANLEEILEYLAFSLYKQGNLKQALLLTDELFRMNPNHPRAEDNVREYEDLLENDGVQRIYMRQDIPPIINIRDENDLDEGTRLIYEALCRQEMPVYKMDHPYLRLAPFKVEIARQNPLAVLFYDIISDEEARIIQMLAVPKLKQFMLLNVLTGNFELPSSRVAKR